MYFTQQNFTFMYSMYLFYFVVQKLDFGLDLKFKLFIIHIILTKKLNPEIKN